MFRSKRLESNVEKWAKKRSKTKGVESNKQHSHSHSHSHNLQEGSLAPRHTPVPMKTTRVTPFAGPRVTCRLSMVELWLLLLRLITHCAFFSGLCQKRLLLLLTICDFLILLHKVTRQAAAGTQAIGATVSFEMVFRSNVAAAYHWKNEANTKMKKNAESCALENPSH